MTCCKIRINCPGVWHPAGGVFFHFFHFGVLEKDSVCIALDLC